MSEILEFFEYILENEKTLKYLYQGSALGFLLFILYLELSPKLGNIWFRYGPDGLRAVQLDSLRNFLTYPFKSFLFWKPENWDLNFIMASGILGVLYMITREALEYNFE